MRSPASPYPGIDFGRTADDYARHRAGFPPAFFHRLRRDAWVRPGMRALDLGTGTGTVALGLARHGCRVTALDRSGEMLAAARHRAAAQGLDIAFIQSRAETTGLSNGSFDVVTAGQCWHWFDRAAAAAEARRLLVPSGRLILARFDWLPLPGSVPEATEAVILAHNPIWPMADGSGMDPNCVRDADRAGFTDLASFSFDVTVSYSHDDWVGRIRASAGVAAAGLDGDAIARFDADLRQRLADRFPQEPMAVPHRVWAVAAIRPA